MGTAVYYKHSSISNIPLCCEMLSRNETFYSDIHMTLDPIYSSPCLWPAPDSRTATTEPQEQFPPFEEPHLNNYS